MHGFSRPPVLHYSGNRSTLSYIPPPSVARPSTTASQPLWGGGQQSASSSHHPHAQTGASGGFGLTRPAGLSQGLGNITLPMQSRSYVPPPSAGAGASGVEKDPLPTVDFWCGLGVGADGALEIHGEVQEHLNMVKKLLAGRRVCLCVGGFEGKTEKFLGGRVCIILRRGQFTSITRRYVEMQLWPSVARKRASVHWCVKHPHLGQHRHLFCGSLGCCSCALLRRCFVSGAVRSGCGCLCHPRTFHASDPSLCGGGGLWAGHASVRSSA